MSLTHLKHLKPFEYLENTTMKNCQLVPYLSVADAKGAVDYYSRVFECEPVLLLTMPDGRVMHCEFQIGDARLMFSDELPEHGGTPSPATAGGTTVAVHLYVEDCNETVERMKANGAQVLMEPADLFWGERFARVRGPFGHEWGLATRIREMPPAEIQSAAAAMFENAE